MLHHWDPRFFLWYSISRDGWDLGRWLILIQLCAVPIMVTPGVTHGHLVDHLWWVHGPLKWPLLNWTSSLCKCYLPLGSCWLFTTLWDGFPYVNCFLTPLCRPMNFVHILLSFLDWESLPAAASPWSPVHWFIIYVIAVITRTLQGCTITVKEMLHSQSGAVMFSFTLSFPLYSSLSSSLDLSLSFAIPTWTK